jgi:competence protein ComFC
MDFSGINSMVWGGTQLYQMKQYIGDVLFPVFCLGCQREGEWVCRDCLVQIPPLTQTSCFSCDATVMENACCDNCKKERSVDVYWSLYSHQTSIISDLIEQLKYHGASDVVRAVSLLCETNRYVHSLIHSVDMIIPVPLYPARFRERGFNQSEYIAYAIGEVLHVPIVSSVLQRSKQTKQQARLSLEERKGNVLDAFACAMSDEVKGKRILLVDDVLTTGSTVDACARVLMGAGAQTVRVLTLARG